MHQPEACRHIERARRRAPKLYEDAFARAAGRYLKGLADEGRATEAAALLDHLDQVFEEWRSEMPTGAW